ncbi:MAG TPA: zf-HC2 domain-containing protein [Pyrinomonadaceae bacterium]
MKCVDCLPLLEEFFDGEVDDKTNGRMRDHLAVCADCAEAFDALRAEQEMFLRYDRELEISPALWQGVRAAIADERPRPERRPFLLSLRERLAAAAALFALRPALASSLALMAVGITAGLLWQAASQRPTGVAPTDIADSNGGARPAPSTDQTAITSTAPQVAQINDGETPDGDDEPGEVAPVKLDGEHVKPETAARVSSKSARVPAAPDAGDGIVRFLDADHAITADDSLPSVASASQGGDDLADAAALLDPEDEAVARHVERAQVLLRSFKNTRAAEGEGDLAYERELSRKLLEENITLQLDADADGNKKAKKVLSQLEPYLTDISNLRDRPEREQLRSIKERMQKQEIIAALHVYDD